MSMQAVEK